MIRQLIFLFAAFFVVQSSHGASMAKEQALLEEYQLVVADHTAGIEDAILAAASDKNKLAAIEAKVKQAQAKIVAAQKMADAAQVSGDERAMKLAKHKLDFATHLVGRRSKGLVELREKVAVADADIERLKHELLIEQARVDAQAHRVGQVKVAQAKAESLVESKAR